MKLTADQNAHLDAMLNEVSGEFAEADIRPLWTAFLHDELNAGRLGDPVEELSMQSLKRAIDRRGWKFETGQGALFDADAILALGDGAHVRMGDATARHIARHGAVLDENNRRQNSAYQAKRSQIDRWLPPLFEQGCTLSALMDIEQGSAEAA